MSDLYHFDQAGPYYDPKLIVWLDHNTKLILNMEPNDENARAVADLIFFFNSDAQISIEYDMSYRMLKYGQQLIG